MALSVLGALQSSASLEVMQQSARNAKDDPQVRWEAVRQIIGLDAAKGLTLLDEMARDQTDSLARAASDLAANLRRAHPALRSIDREAA